MLEGQDHQDWHRSPFLRYYEHKFPDVYDEVDLRLHPRRKSKQPKAAPAIVPIMSQQQQERMPNTSVRAQRLTRRTGHDVPSTPKPASKEVLEGETSADESYDSDGKMIQAGTKRKSKSILRPKGSKVSKKVAKRRQSLAAAVDQSEEDAAGSDIDTEQPEVSPLAAVTQRELPYRRYQPPAKAAEVKMVAYDLPSGKPQGPGDLWTCTFENCNHRVHQGSKPKGKAQIKAHFHEHARSAQERIDLALLESRPYLPVSNLVRRIQLAQSNVKNLAQPVQ
ncbi:MAG: hypothetical protein Q9174_000236 [Haloplaca sp. 1 TL-2023]